MRPRRNWGARLHEYAWQDMRVLFLENEELRVGVNATRGGELFELCWKPRDVDFAWLSSHALAGVPPPAAGPDPELAFIHRYPGGWQEVFPNGGAPSTHRGVRFGQHDEVWQLAWDVDVVEDDPRAVAVALAVRTVRVPCRLRKELWLRAGRPRLELRETVENLSGDPVEVMWGHHVTFGPPFLGEGCRIAVPDGVRVVPHAAAINPPGRRVRPVESTWPLAAAPDGSPVDLGLLPPPGAPSDIVYLHGFREGWYEVRDPAGLGLRVTWDAAVLPYLWFWQEFGAWRHHPWFGRHYNVGLEPFSSYPTDGLAEAVRNGTALVLEPHGRRQLHLTAEVVHD
ncbi:MAG TPA: DUF4432 family protein [Candidatus Dormibacteraeota bacterium]